MIKFLVCELFSRQTLYDLLDAVTLQLVWISLISRGYNKNWDQNDEHEIDSHLKVTNNQDQKH